MYWGGRKEQGKTVRGRKRESAIHSSPRWAIFLFFPFISVETRTEQKAAHADESNRPDDAVCALLFGEEEDEQWDLDNQVFQRFYSILSSHEGSAL